jgi:2-polyprenyl-3-methyl-5-hydroxy-6-metoxy-1,4-benzoquinol methylase
MKFSGEPITEDKTCRGPVRDQSGSFTVIDCERCGWVHVAPVPSAAELAELYRSHYYGTEKPLYIQRYEEDRPWWEMTYADRYDTLESLLPEERRRILDVGSGPGLFLDTGRKRGWDVLGIEPSVQAAAHSRSLGLEIVEEFLTAETAKGLGRFDAIHMSEVLEHIPNPIDFLGICSTLLNPGGVICIVVPNDYNPLQQVLREQDGYAPWWLAPPHHLNYFTPSSLGAFVTRAGYDVRLTETTFPIEFFLLFGDNYVGNDALGRQCHQRRKRLEVLMNAGGQTPLRRRIYQSLAKEGIGREVMMFATKP